MSGYEPLKAPRFRKEQLPGGYEFLIPARRNWFALIFLGFWLFFWTLGGGLALVTDIREPQLFISLWLVGWALGWLFAASQILFMLTGAEYIRCVGGDLELGYKGLVLPRRRQFRGNDVRRLEASDPANIFGNLRGWGYSTPGMRQSGAIRFDYGARTVYAANGLDRAEAAMIVEDLQRSLPAAR